ncbi:hypothetical protein F3J34_30300 [Klebsiella sp. Ap-873]|nr:hypothetical protein [Klebsiella sp. Ap-873]
MTKPKIINFDVSLPSSAHAGHIINQVEKEMADLPLTAVNAIRFYQEVRRRLGAETLISVVETQIE